MKLDLNANVDFFPSFLSKEEAVELFDHLSSNKALTSPAMLYSNDQIITYNFGKLSFISEHIIRHNLIPVEHHGSHVIWSKQMKNLLSRIEKMVKRSFDICVCIFYPNGSSGVDFHSDLISFGDTSLIPSLSLGATRRFQFREKRSGRIHDLVLESGDLVIMGEFCQERYEHAVPVDINCTKPRINLTFRPYGFKN